MVKYPPPSLAPPAVVFLEFKKLVININKLGKIAMTVDPRREKSQDDESAILFVVAILICIYFYFLSFNQTLNRQLLAVPMKGGGVLTLTTSVSFDTRAMTFLD